MGGSDVTLGLAFLAGIISFVSPCVLPLVPAYVGYMGGRMTQQVHRQSESGGGSSFGRRFGTLTHGVFFVLGFTLFFVLFGLLTTAAVSSLTAFGVTEGEVSDGIARIGGTAVVFFGLHLMGILNRILMWLLKQTQRLDKNPYGNLISALAAIVLIGVVYWLFVESWFLTLLMVLVFTQLFNDALKADTPGDFWSRVILKIQTALYVDTRRQSQPTSQYGYLGSMFMGVVFSAGWTPCIGPVYGTVLTMANSASSGDKITEAGLLMAAYSLGLGIPFLLTALALDQAQGVFRRLQRNMRLIEAVSGIFLILIGVLIFSGQLERLTQVGGSQGTLADISFNLEDCTIAAFEDQINWGSWSGCMGDGLKETFYLAVSKGTPQVDASSESADVLTTDAGDISDLGAETEVSGTDSVPSLEPPAIPSLGGDASAEDGALSAPELDAESSDVPVGLAVGERAPDFTAQTLDGETVSLADFRGQTVLLNFWATWCTPCGAEMPDFQIVYETYQADGFVVLAVNNMESPDTVMDFADDRGLTFPILLDEAGDINLGTYRDGIIGYPTSFLLDADGVIVEKYTRGIEGSELVQAITPLLEQ